MAQDMFVLIIPNNLLMYRTGKVVIKDANIGTAYFTGGGFEGRYWAAQLHFHWGVSNDLGSDHTFNGIHYPAAVIFLKPIFVTIIGL